MGHARAERPVAVGLVVVLVAPEVDVLREAEVAVAESDAGLGADRGIELRSGIGQSVSAGIVSRS